MKQKCSACKINYDSRLVNNMSTNGIHFMVCPLCALDIKNAIHGTDDQEFSGVMAQAFLVKATMLLTKRNFLIKRKNNADEFIQGILT